jgi:hypothetical protein
MSPCFDNKMEDKIESKQIDGVQEEHKTCSMYVSANILHEQEECRFASSCLHEKSSEGNLQSHQRLHFQGSNIPPQNLVGRFTDAFRHAVSSITTQEPQGLPARYILYTGGFH